MKFNADLTPIVMGPGIDYRFESKRTLNSLRCEGLSVEELKAYLESGEMPTI